MRYFDPPDTDDPLLVGYLVTACSKTGGETRRTCDVVEMAEINGVNEGHCHSALRSVATLV